MATSYISPEIAPARNPIWTERPDEPVEQFTGIITEGVTRLLFAHTEDPRSEIRGIVRASCDWLVADHVDTFVYDHALEAAEIAGRLGYALARWEISEPGITADPERWLRSAAKTAGLESHELPDQVLYIGGDK